jgi:predicted DNA-binding protein (MmcQ/YjbR family)
MPNPYALSCIAEEAVPVTFEQVHAYMLSLPGAVEDRPFAPDVPVYKIGGKMFAFASPKSRPPRLTLKLAPWHGQQVRDTYEAVYAGYHMNKDHWNTIDLDGTVPHQELLSWIDESYTLVFEALPERIRKQLAEAPELGDP